MDIVIEHGDVPSQNKIDCDRVSNTCNETGNRGIYVALNNRIRIEFQDEEDGLIVGKAICRRLGHDVDESNAAMREAWNFMLLIYDFNRNDNPLTMRMLIGQLHHTIGLPDSVPGYREACQYRKAKLAGKM